jgi:hypothetical protein
MPKDVKTNLIGAGDKMPNQIDGRSIDGRTLMVR